MLRVKLGVDVVVRRCQLSLFGVIRRSLTNEEIRSHRLRVFAEESRIQVDRIRRVEKIEIRVEDGNESKKFLMNQSLSTPFHCAKHLSSILSDRSCLALIDNEQIWDMNRPLQGDCSVKFLHFLEENCEEQNRAYWRTCSFILGYLLESSFKEKYLVELCSFPPPHFQSGSFAYDAKLHLGNSSDNSHLLCQFFLSFFLSFFQGEWQPTLDDLRCLSIQASQLRSRDLRFEPLEITQAVAEEMFAHDRFKLSQIPSMLRRMSPEDRESRLTVYRMGEAHVDITRGPLISSTKQIGRFEFAAIHPIDVPSYGETMHRVQGLSIPNQLHLHYWTFDYLLQRARRRNRASLPSLAKDKAVEQQTSVA